MFYKSNDEMDAYWNDAFYERADWSKKFVLWPRRCDKTRKLIWLTTAYIGHASWSGPGDAAHEYRWLTKDTYIFELLKGTIK